MRRPPVRLKHRTAGHIRTRFDEPFTLETGRYNVDVRYRVESGRPSRFRLLVNCVEAGVEWTGVNGAGQWSTHTLTGVTIRRDDELTVAVQTEAPAAVWLDYVQLNLRGSAKAETFSATRPSGQ